MGQQLHASVVAVTGGMGSGKSSVSAYLCEIGGAQGLNADTICRQLLEPEASGWLAVRQAFGGRFFLPDHSIDRPLLRQVLFADQEFRRELNALLHPLVRKVISGCIAAELERNPPARPRFVVEVPLLYEAHWEHDFSPVVVTYADATTCLRRIMQRDRINEAEAEKGLAAQMPLPHKALLADHVIDNSGPWSDTCLQILHLRELLW
ncbi:dephospho-CoA kinase [Thiovibrio frasassiensis]|uniref:Dephospho-CoA kinase n=1 Tax=Thiovibrio frasassiensis TaxID=2984131 RepID=A0A9X4MGP4_9BACT|nr:dephospho-CoA kinase [Thiovibrio frasassiensis]MDG4476926.1 dephospho-CoA kinase [Thiovibrio frasassiensis]